jgi:hypothetical protein
MEISSFRWVVLILALILSNLTHSLAQNSEKTVTSTTVNSEGRIVGHTYSDGSWSVCIGCGYAKEQNPSGGRRGPDRPDQNDQAGDSGKPERSSPPEPTVAPDGQLVYTDEKGQKYVNVSKVPGRNDWRKYVPGTATGSTPSSQGILDEFGTPANFTPNPGKLTALVEQHKGRLPLSIRQKYPQQLWLNNRVFLSQATSNGHNYIRFSPLVKVGMSVEALNTFLRQSFVSVFPYGTVLINGQPSVLPIKQNDRLTLRVIGTKNDVTVSYISDYLFTLTAADVNHRFSGTATHGIVMDSTGELWLFEEGIGNSSNTSYMREVGNNLAGIHMWDRLAANLNTFILTKWAPQR